MDKLIHDEKARAPDPAAGRRARCGIWRRALARSACHWPAPPPAPRRAARRASALVARRRQL